MDTIFNMVLMNKCLLNITYFGNACICITYVYKNYSNGRNGENSNRRICDFILYTYPKIMVMEISFLL